MTQGTQNPLSVLRMVCAGIERTVSACQPSAIASIVEELEIAFTHKPLYKYAGVARGLSISACVIATLYFVTQF